MSGPATERLYTLLPAIYRLRDADEGEPLRALLAVIESELQAIEADIGALYDNWFIETCDEWVVPYIGDLLGVRDLHPVSPGTFSQRAYVANTLAYRRRKGSAAMLEQLARDVTGWPARVVEFFELLATTQHLNYLRPANLRTPNMRATDQLELLSSPFDRLAHTVDVRHINDGRSKYNIPNVGIFLWRLQSYFVTRSTARAVSTPPDGRYRFNPLDVDAPLFNRTQTETESTTLAEEINLPGPLRRRLLYDELEAHRKALVDGETPHLAYFGDQPVLQVFVQKTNNGPLELIPAEEILICDLSNPASPPLPLADWRRPPTSKPYIDPDGKTVEWPIQVAVDPELGRLAFPTGLTPSQVQVSYAYGFSGDVGGGPYNRSAPVSGALDRPVTWRVGVSKERAPVPNKLFATLTEAVRAWNAQPAGTVGMIALLDSHTYAENLTGDNVIEIPEGSQLLIEILEGHRTHLRGNLSVRGIATGSSSTPGELALAGLMIEGALTVLVGNLGCLRVIDCTLVPGTGGLMVNSSSVTLEQQNAQLSISIDRSICGRIDLPRSVPRLCIVDSIIDGTGGQALDAPGVAASIRTSTLLGGSTMRTLEASNSIFTGTVHVERRQIGCVRFCYLPMDSLAPRRYRCQSADATAPGRMSPQFTSLTYGQPGYGQLAISCPGEISAGAEDEGEMGAFHFLQQAQRIKNLQANLDEYLRFGLEAGIIFVT